MANPQIEDGHIKIAVPIVEALARVNLSAYESRVLWCIFRKTYGWNKKWDRISRQQFEEATGILPRHVARTVAVLISRQMINCRKDGKYAEYSIQKDYEKWQDSCGKSHSLSTKPVPKGAQGAAGSIGTERGTDEKPATCAPLGRDLYQSGAQLVPIGAQKPVPKGAHTIDSKALNKSIIQKTIPVWAEKKLWEEFLEVRHKKHVDPTPFAVDLLLKELEKLRAAGNDPNEVLKQSIMRGWTGLFPLKGNPSAAPKTQTGNRPAAGKLPQKYTRPEDL